MIEILTVFFRIFSKLKRMSNIASAKKAGLKIGQGTILVGDQAFGSEPFLIEIGRDCLVTDGVKFVTHDGAIQVPLIAAGERIEDVYSNKSIFAKIKIGDNVFIGISSIILPGTNVGSNSIVAAGSVVKGDFPANVVLGGQPAKVICGTDDYYKKNIGRILDFGSDEDRKSQVLSHLMKFEK